MDDITFFESSSFQHRGGIWADASRHEHRTNLFSSPSQSSTDDVRSTSSVPTPDPSKTMSPDLEPSPDLKRSQSTEDARVDAGPSSPLSSLSFTRPTATSVESSPPSSSPGRRRTWFGAPRDEMQETSASASALGEEDDQAYVRGRTTSTLSRTSSSRKSDGQHTDSEEVQYLAPEARRRASSNVSQSSSYKDGSLSAGEGLDDADSDMPATRSDTMQSNGSARPTSSASSFLQTLRSRATDKQALSNTAKEAMRKWGVNWSNLRRDNNAHTEEVSDVEPQRFSDNRSRARPSYAEVRAAVDQRHRRDVSQAGAVEGVQPSEPVTIPGHDRERSRSTSYTGQSGLLARANTAPTSRSVSPRPTGIPALQPGTSSPALPPRQTELNAPSTSQEAPVMISDDLETPPAPIYTQPPQANKTMTIPGIHASHRGEVMSMGYAPPTPPAATEQKKAPAIQSVYRLWKNPNGSAAGQQPQVALSDGQVQTQIGFSGTDQDVSTTSQPIPAEPPSRPTPPPLPPRTISTNAKPGSPKLLAENDQMATASPASAALQSIAEKDRTKRASLTPSASPGRPEDTENRLPSTPPSPSQPPSPSPDMSSPRQGPQPPALPPRRIRANA